MPLLKTCSCRPGAVIFSRFSREIIGNSTNNPAVKYIAGFVVFYRFFPGEISDHVAKRHGCTGAENSILPTEPI